jgi:DNA-binding SARP family transcriptional activator
MRFIFFLLTIVLTQGLLAMQTDGVYFKSKEVQKEKRTGIDFTADGLINYTGNFRLTFDVSFREGQDRFGYIFRLKEIKGGNVFDLVAKLDGASPGLYLVVNQSETHIGFPLDNRSTNWVNRWDSVSLFFSADSGYVEATALGFTRRQSFVMPTRSQVGFFFGVAGLYGLVADETPPMSLRNVRFTVDGKEVRHWPLRKTHSGKSHDLVGKNKAKLIYPDWVADYHSRWQQLDSLVLKSVPQIVYDSTNEQFLFMVQPNELIAYSLNDKTTSRKEWKKGFPVLENSHQLLLHNGQLVTYSFNHAVASVYNDSLSQWSHTVDLPEDLPRYWHHNRLIHPVDGAITTLCGYGFYTYKNTIQRFNANTRIWEKLAFDGDTIYPRYLAGFGLDDDNKGIGYLFGGMGNRSGKQILGKEFYGDLYRIDFRLNRIERLWNIDEAGVFFTPVNSLIVNSKDSCFYTLAFSHQKQKTSLRVLKGSLQNAHLEWIGDSLPYDFEDVKSYADLVEWKSRNKLVAYTLEEEEGYYKVRLWSVYAPPANVPEVIEAGFSGKSVLLGVIFISTFLLLVTIGALVRLKRRAGVSTKSASSYDGLAIQSVDNELVESFFADCNCRIVLFGEFQVFNVSGVDVTYLFSPTLKELFLLIFLNSAGRNGISSPKIQELIWPDKSSESARNNRGVNIKKLRTVLDEVGGISLEFEQNLWFVKLDDKLLSDYVLILSLLKDRPLSADKLKLVQKLICRGSFLSGVEADWLDEWKERINSEVTEFLERAITNPDIRKDNQLSTELANTLFKFDRLNEPALVCKCTTLVSQGKSGLAIEVYENFCKLYRKSYNEEYPHTFQEVLKITGKR